MVNALDIVAAVFVVLVLVGLGAYVVTLYNRLVRVQRRADAAWSDIDVLLTQRQDELTKLVEAVEKSMDHEQDVLTSLTEARAREQQATTPREEAATGEQVKQALVDIEARAEEYPELRSSGNVQHLQEQISTIETQLADRREVYNKAATAQNELVQQIPYVFFTKLAGIEQRELYDPPAEETTDVDVSRLGTDTEDSEQTA